MTDASRDRDERSAPPVGADADNEFEVVLARSGRIVPVGADDTILGALLQRGIYARHSCQAGLCGECETDVVEGVPDHRDLVLSPSEKAANRTVMICCSRALTPRLVLDL